MSEKSRGLLAPQAAESLMRTGAVIGSGLSHLGGATAKGIGNALSGTCAGKAADRIARGFQAASDELTERTAEHSDDVCRLSTRCRS